MNLATAAGILLTSGISSYAIMEYQETLKAVKEIQPEPLEDVSKGMTVKEAIEIVRRNDAKRKKLILKLHNSLQNTP